MPTNNLQLAADFRAALHDYHLSPAALLTLSQTKLVLLVAPTSSGRNTVIRELLKTGGYHYIVSDTTRQPRVNDGVPEQNGHEYWFRSEAEVLADIRAGKYLEAAIIHDQQVSGISVRELELATQEGKIAITDAEINGADNVIKSKPDSMAIFVVPPSFEEWQRRIKHRGHMEPAEFRRRMESATTEFRTALNRDYYHFVINESVQQAVEDISRLANSGVADPADQAEARQLTEQLLTATESLLATL